MSEELKIQFFTAVANNQINVVKELITDHHFIKNLLSLPEECDKLLTCACIENNHPEMFETLLAKMAIEGAFANHTLLHACKQGNYQIVNRLVQKNVVDVNYSLHGETPLDITIKNGLVEIVNLLIEKGAQVKLGGGYLRGESCWAVAAAHGQVNMLKYLLEKCSLDDHDLAILIEPIAKVNNREDLRSLLKLLDGRLDFKSQEFFMHGKTIIEITLDAISHSGNVDLFDILFNRNDIGDLNENGIDLNEHGILYKACENGYVDLVEHLLNFGLNPDALTEHGTALHAACSANSIDVLRLLLTTECNVNAVNPYGDTPLSYLASLCPNAMVDMAKVLVSSGADINYLNLGQSSVLAVAIESIRLYPNSNTIVDIIDFIDFILSLNPNVNTVDEMGLTPLMCAVKGRCVEIVELLLANNNMDYSITNKAGLTAAEMAEQVSPEMAKLFIDTDRPSFRP